MMSIESKIYRRQHICFRCADIIKIKKKPYDMRSFDCASMHDLSVAALGLRWFYFIYRAYKNLIGFKKKKKKQIFYLFISVVANKFLLNSIICFSIGPNKKKKMGAPFILYVRIYLLSRCSFFMDGCMKDLCTNDGPSFYAWFFFFLEPFFLMSNLLCSSRCVRALPPPTHTLRNTYKKK